MAQRIQRLCSIKGVGFQTALSLSCLLQEIGLISTKQRAALVDVAPFVHDSGLRCAKRSIRGGRAKLRSQLYMAALVASRFNPILRDVYPRLIQRGKPKKLLWLLSSENSSSPCITSLKNLPLFFLN